MYNIQLNRLAIEEHTRMGIPIASKVGAKDASTVFASFVPICVVCTISHELSDQ